MKTKNTPPFSIKSISQQHALMGLPKPHHPLLSIIKFEEIKDSPAAETGIFTTEFYTVTIKRNCTCKMKYGQNFYDFDQGIMSFFAPGQLLSWDAEDKIPSAGWSIAIHPDFLRNYSLGQKIKEYGFFQYSVSEALHLRRGKRK